MKKALLVGLIAAAVVVILTCLNSRGGNALELAQLEGINALRDRNGEVVTVRGYLVLRFESTVLFYDASAKSAFDTKRAVWLNLKNGRRFFSVFGTEGEGVVRGRLTMRSGVGHLGAFEGELDDVEIVALPRFLSFQLLVVLCVNILLIWGWASWRRRGRRKMDSKHHGR